MFNWKKIPPLVRIPLVYGILGGLLSLAFLITFYYFGKHPFFINPFFDIRVLLIAIFLFFSLREVRDYFFGGILFFGQAVAGSLVFLGAMSAVSTAGIMLYGSYEKRFVKDYIDQGLEQIKKFSPEAIKQIGQQAVDELRQTLPTSTLADLAEKYFFQTLIIGSFITIIISVILRRQPKTQ